MSGSQLSSPRNAPSCRERSAPGGGALGPTNGGFSLLGPIVALAVLNRGRDRGAELSIVSVYDGEIGDPVTWVDQPAPAPTRGCRAKEGVRAFSAVANDIRAHLSDDAVAIHGAPTVLELVRQILPGWRPKTVIDTLSLAQQVPLPANDLDIVRPRTERGTDPSSGVSSPSSRALATARLLVHIASTLPNRVGPESR